MSSRTADAVITAALRDLDPAPTTRLTEAEQARADALLARIVATPRGEHVAVEPPAPLPRRRRLLVTGGLAAAATAASVAIPGLLLGGGTAYGSWTPTPQPLSAATAVDAATTCRAVLGPVDPGAHVALAERRGGWTYVLLAGSGSEAVCLMPDDLVGQEPAPGGDLFGSYDPDTVAPPPLAPDRIDEQTSMTNHTDEGAFTFTEGYVGSDVTGVTVHISSGLDVEASVAGNRFAAWWPSVEQSSDHPESESWYFTVHLADGGSREVTG